MKKNMGFILIFLLSFNLFSQSGVLLKNSTDMLVFNENYLKSDFIIKKDTSVIKKNLFCIDIGIPTLAFSYTRNIKNSNWYLGGGLGLYGDYFLQKFEVENAYEYNTRSTLHLYEFLNISIQSNYMFSNNFILRSGITFQPVYTGDEYIEGFVFTGIFFSPLLGFKHYKIGTRFLIGLVDPFAGDDLNPVIYYNPLIFFSFNL